ncbi:hypothetical protein [Agromyces sp. PvR057]|uniref:hypothetical protein n=1 Tax=Agromyces sp. PvR057 TaxID=3156403 RepID=UPI000E236604
MNKIAKTALTTSLVIAGVFGASGAANAADALDLGSPYLTHGTIGAAHVRGGDWVLTSTATTTAAAGFASYNAPAALLNTITAKTTQIERLRLTFTPDADVTPEALAAEFASESEDLAVGSTWFKGFVVGNSQVLNGKVVVHVFRIAK